MRFIPGSNDTHIIATQTVETDKGCCSYVMVVDLEGNVLMPPAFLGEHKYEGLEIMDATGMPWVGSSIAM